MSYCGYCGAENSETAAFCKKCGKEISKPNKVLTDTNTNYFQRVFAGRIGIGDYWLGYFIGIVVFCIATWLSPGEEIQWWYFIIICLYVVYNFSLSVRRLHDLDKTAWYLLLFVVPIANFILGIYLAFFSGTKGANRFGEQPTSANRFKRLFGLRSNSILDRSI